MLVYHFSFAKEKGYSIQKENIYTKSMKNMRKLKAQFGIMEYILLSVFLIAILVISVFLLFGFEQFREKGTGTKEITNKQLLSIGLIAHSDLFIKDDMQLDDSKLLNFLNKDDCDDLEKIIGLQACIEIEALLPSAKEDNKCDAATTYPDCNKWTICEDVCISKGGFRILTMPINIYRKIQNRIDFGILTFKVPS